MDDKKINRLLIIGYAGIVLAYGLLLYVKLQPTKATDKKL